MDTIIIKKANYPVIEKVLKKKYILYNNENKILFLKVSNAISLPKNVNYSSGYTITLFDNVFKPLLKDEVEELVRLVGYYDRFKEINNKLKKCCFESINEYYTYFMEFNSDFINSILNDLEKENIIPHLLTAEEFLRLGKMAKKEDKEAIKVLVKKLNYER